MKYSIVFLLILGSYRTALAQTKTTAHAQQVWLGYFNQLRFSDQWGLWVDAHLRTKEDWIDQSSVSIIRLALTRYISNQTKISFGYAWVNFFPGDNHPLVTQAEHRPWQQVQWHTQYGNKRMMQWIRLEERFREKIAANGSIGDGYQFNFKLRYNIWYEIPFKPKLTGPGDWSLILNDELHVNFGKEIVNNYFDQNRFFVGAKYQLNTSSNIQVGYMYFFQQLASGNQYKDINALRIFFFQNIDLRQPKRTGVKG